MVTTNGYFSNSIKELIFIMDTDCVLCELGTELFLVAC
jgi:hypothetical protein